MSKKSERQAQKNTAMLYANYHTHTYRCHHADGTEREYIENAIENGIKILGFADHCPYIFSGKEYDEFLDGHYYSAHRMLPEEAEGYFMTLTDLRDEYKNDIEIHIGFEMEYYPLFAEKTFRFFENFPCEYLILGQHFVDNEIGPNELTVQAPSPSAERAERYTALVKEALATGKYLYLAHPDTLKFTGSDDVRRKMDEEICAAAKKYNIPLEINLLGIRGNRNYPRDSFWEVAGRYGNRVVIGSDAHRPCDVGDVKSWEKAMEIAKKHGLSPEKKLQL